MRNQAWAAFYNQPPHEVGDAIMAAFAFLLHGDGVLSDDPEHLGVEPLPVFNHLDFFANEQGASL